VIGGPAPRDDVAQPATSPFLAAAQRLEADERLDAVALAMVGASAAWVSGYLGGHMSLRRHIGTGDPSRHTTDATT
jgi:hypothetical protein